MADNADPYDDRRKAPRSDIQDTLFIKSISSSQVTSLSSELKTCNTVNVSAYGMQVIIDFELLVDSDIALWIYEEANDERILVNGTVRWTSKAPGESKYLIGIELNEDSVDPIKDWLEKNNPEAAQP